jgi:hypothetical protein
MKLWIDDVRPAPKGYVWCKSVNEAKYIIEYQEASIADLGRQVRELDAIGNYEEADHLHMVAANSYISVIDIDHDAGDYASDGGDYIRLLDWLEETGRNYPIRIHSMNPVGVANMRRIIERNGWKEVL